MKKLVFVGAFAATFAVSNAQNRNVITAYNYGIKQGQTQYDKAMKAIDEAIEHPETKENEKAWYYRGLIYQSIFQSPIPAHKELHPNPLKEAAASYMNSIKFKDKKERYAGDALKNLKVVRSQAFNEGIKMFEAKDYEKAAQYFELSAEIGNHPDVNFNEEAVYFNLALCLEKSGNFDAAKAAYKTSAEKNYEPVGCVRKVADMDLAKGDTLGYVNTLKDGISKLADNQLLMLLLIDFYSKAQQFDEALAYLEKAIELEPANKVYHFAKGTFFDQKGESEKAFAAYNKALEIDPVYFDAIFNLGVLYFNKGADLNNKANDIPPHKTKEYEDMRELAFAEFIKSTEYFEKALEINPKDLVSMKQLKLIYFQLRTKPGFNDKLKAIDEKILHTEQ